MSEFPWASDGKYDNSCIIPQWGLDGHPHDYKSGDGKFSQDRPHAIAQARDIQSNESSLKFYLAKIPWSRSFA